MPAATETLRQLFKNIAGAIRIKDGSTLDQKIDAMDFPYRISAIRTGPDTSDATAVASDILSGKVAYGAEGRIEGTLVPEEGVDTSDATAVASDILSGKVAYGAEGRIEGTLVPEEGVDTSDATAVASDILSGKVAYGPDGKITGTMPNAGTITGQLGVTGDVNWSTSDPNRGSGTVTITGVNQTAGYTPGISNGSIFVTVPTNRFLKGRTIIPGRSAIPVGNAEDILYGAISVAGDNNFLASNIRSGVSIFGVSGTFMDMSETNKGNVEIRSNISSTARIIGTKNDGTQLDMTIDPGGYANIYLLINSIIMIITNEKCGMNIPGFTFLPDGSNPTIVIPFGSPSRYVSLFRLTGTSGGIEIG